MRLGLLECIIFLCLSDLNRSMHTIMSYHCQMFDYRIFLFSLEIDFENVLMVRELKKGWKGGKEIKTFLFIIHFQMSIQHYTFNGISM